MVQHGKITKLTFFFSGVFSWWILMWGWRMSGWEALCSLLACSGHRCCTGEVHTFLWGHSCWWPLRWGVRTSGYHVGNQMHNVFFSCSTLPFNAPTEWTWSKSRTILPPKHSLKISLTIKSHQQQMLHETKILWKHFSAANAFVASLGDYVKLTKLSPMVSQLLFKSGRIISVICLDRRCFDAAPGDRLRVKSEMIAQVRVLIKIQNSIE